MTGYPQSGVWGKPETVSIGNPGAGVLLTTTVPANESWWFWMLSFTFTASGVPGNRFLKLEIQNGGVVVQASPKSTAAVTAGLTIRFFYQLELPASAGFVDGRWFQQMPVTLLPPSMLLTMQVDAFDAGDTFTDSRLVISRSYL